MLKRKLQKLLIVTMVYSLCLGSSLPIHTSSAPPNLKLLQLVRKRN